MNIQYSIHTVAMYDNSFCSCNITIETATIVSRECCEFVTQVCVNVSNRAFILSCDKYWQ